MTCGWFCRKVVRVLGINSALMRGADGRKGKTMCEYFVLISNHRNLSCSLCGKDRSDLIRLFPKTWHHIDWWQQHDNDDILMCGKCKDISEVEND